MEVIYFKPKGIKEGYCEAGIIHKGYIWYLHEPCKILLSEVEIVPKENVMYDRKTRTYKVI